MKLKLAVFAFILITSPRGWAQPNTVFIHTNQIQDFSHLSKQEQNQANLDYAKVYYGPNGYLSAIWKYVGESSTSSARLNSDHETRSEELILSHTYTYDELQCDTLRETYVSFLQSRLDQSAPQNRILIAEHCQAFASTLGEDGNRYILLPRFFLPPLLGAALDQTATSIQPLSDKRADILLIGNSFTRNWNKNQPDSPTLLRKLIRASFSKKRAKSVNVVYVASGSATWYDHARSSFTRNTITSRKWDAIFFQEQSFFLSRDLYSIARSSLPNIRTLFQTGSGSYDGFHYQFSDKLILFNTWGYRGGDPGRAGLNDTYFAMQDRLKDGINFILNSLKESSAFHPQISPVGEAWRSLVGQDVSSINLWDTDGQHPSLKGRYFTTLVWYFTVFGTDAPVRYRPRGVNRSLQAKMIQTAKSIVSQCQWCQ